MEEHKTELKQLTSKIKELQLALSATDEPEGSRQYKILLSQVQILQKEIMMTKTQLRQRKCEKIFEKSQKSSILSKISKNPCKTSPVKSSYIQKLTDLVSGFNGKATLLNQLKKLLLKEKENLELRVKLSAVQRKRIDLGKDYAEITKKLSEDNDLSKKIKYLEEQIPLKAASLDLKRKELGQLRASVQELKLEVQDYSYEYMQKTINSLQFVQSEMKTTISSLKKELQSIDLQISEATSQKSVSKKINYDLDKVEVKGMQVQLVDKEKEQSFYEKTRKELKSKLENSLKVLSDKKK